MKLFSNRKKIFKRQHDERRADSATVQTAQSGFSRQAFPALSSYIPLRRSENALYLSMREAIPVIDAAISKMRRLLGTFNIICDEKSAQKALDGFLSDVKVGGASRGIDQFLSTYFDQLLTFGTAVGEIVMNESGSAVLGLYNASLDDIELKEGENPLDLRVCVKSAGETREAPFQDRILLSALNPAPGSAEGCSVMKGLPFVSSVLLSVFQTMEQNFERAGNVRYAVTYNPPGNIPPANAKQRAQEIAGEWSKAMRDRRRVCDFISVGDISVKAIGAENQILDFEIPVRTLTEQIVSKLSIPPFMLGLSWSTTERMSAQQADILISEIYYYRTLLTPVLKKIAGVFLKSEGFDGGVQVEWDEMTLQDETELASARLQNAKAALIEEQIKRKSGEKAGADSRREAE